jgi:glyceraldehyde-3-phosphate dehydrogenase/erythrose-4-phosphate dehydrogenase
MKKIVGLDIGAMATRETVSAESVAVSNSAALAYWYHQEWSLQSSLDIIRIDRLRAIS